MIDLSKRGTIILTHYRSGGTLLRNILCQLEVYFNTSFNNFGELDFNEDSYVNDTTVDYKNKIKEVFEDPIEQYQIIQLNNPLVISYLSSIEYFSYLNDNYIIIHLERDNVKKSLLSLPLWERLIDKNLYSIPVPRPKHLMENFHQELLQNPIPYGEIYTGYHFDHPSVHNYRNYLDFQLMLVTNRLHLNRYLKEKYNLISLQYEDYEFFPNKTFIEFFTKINITEAEIKKIHKHCNKQKIEYISEDYLIYFDKYTKEVFNYWDL